MKYTVTIDNTGFEILTTLDLRAVLCFRKEKHLQNVIICYNFTL